MVANKLSVEKIVGIFSLLLALSYLLFLIPIGGVYIYIMGTLIAIFQALTVPTITILISLRIPDGESLGVNQNLKSLGQVFSGFLSLFVSLKFVSLPMIIVFIVGIAGWLLFKLKDKREYY